MAGSSWVYPFYRSAWTTLDWVFPPACGGCGRAGSRWCADCQRRVQILRGDLCSSCGIPEIQSALCRTCELNPPAFYALRSWAVFDAPIQTALHKLKYRRDVGLGDALAAGMSRFVEELHWPIDVIVPIPLGARRRQERGYNQVGLIALPLALSLSVAYEPGSLSRWRETRSQVELNREQRRENVRGAFRAEGKKIGGRNVLLIDDVATTGATLSSGAEALLAAGAKQVYAVTVARALPRHGLVRV